MPLTQTEAHDALEVIAQSDALSRRLAGYAQVGAQLILWGVLWMAGFSLEYVEPSWVNAIWPVIGVGGSIGSFVLARQGGAESDWRIGAGVWILVLLAIALLCVLGPPSPAQIAATNGLIIAAAYMIAGLGLGARLVAIGAFLAVATLLGFYLAGPYFILWMGLAAGGSLILGGLWLKKV
jgi:hypothetical protein